MLDREKYTYTEIWSLKVWEDPLLPDHPLVFTARNNAVLISDVSEVVDKDGFRETLAVRGSFQGSAPIEIGKEYYACKDKDGDADATQNKSASADFTPIVQYCNNLFI